MPTSLWVYLAASPLLWLTATLAAWLIASAVSHRIAHPLANPVAIAVALVDGLLLATHTPYAIYFEGAQFVHFLLGPATVALAVPLVRNRALVVQNLLPMTVALIGGAAVAATSVVILARAFGVPAEILPSLLPKSTTAGIAMAVSEALGGVPALTAVCVIATGIMGAMIVTPLMDALRIRDFAARGFAAGLTSHGIGTARAFAVDEVAGTFAGVAMGLNGLATPVAGTACSGMAGPVRPRAQPVVARRSQRAKTTCETP